ncbi:MAG: nucleotidyltransferase family protein [Candidatus Margulisiibacteriota bacterium]
MINQQEIIQLIHTHKAFLKQQFGFNHIFLFGSFATGTATLHSDVDLLIDVDKSAKTYFNLLASKHYLKTLFNRDIDLVYKDSVHPLIEQEIQNELIEIE